VREDPLDTDPVTTGSTSLLPVLALPGLCLFPGASLALVIGRPAGLAALHMAARTGGLLLALAQREAAAGPRDLPAIGTIASVREIQEMAPLEHRAELDGVSRAQVLSLVGTDLLVSEVKPLPEGDAGEEWGPAVEALARYLHGHPDLRDFLDQQRLSGDPMSWVNLACQHLPIAASARQKLLEASAADRCTKISRGLDALLRKEHGA
jgi:ATP-dependent Lon protease